MAMHALARLLTPDDVLIDVDASGKLGLLENIAQFFEWRHGVNAGLTCKSLLAREELGSTGIGNGVAIPHARMKAIRHTVGVLVRTQRPIEFDASDGRPVSIVLALLVPEHVIELHLHMLATAAKMFADKTFMTRLQSGRSAQDLYAVFTEWPHLQLP